MSYQFTRAPEKHSTTHLMANLFITNNLCVCVTIYIPLWNEKAEVLVKYVAEGILNNHQSQEHKAR